MNMALSWRFACPGRAQSSGWSRRSAGVRRGDSLRSYAHPYDPRRQALQDRKGFKKPQEPGRRDRPGGPQYARNHLILNKYLNCLGDFNGKFPPGLDARETFIRRTRLAQQGLRQQIGGRDGVLNRQIDADAADRRHGVSGVADAQKAGLVPQRQTVDGNA